MGTNGSTPTIGTLLAALRETPLPPASGSSGLSKDEIKNLAIGLARYLREDFAPDLVKQLVQPKLNALRAEINTLKSQLAERTSYGGAWRKENRYRRNEMVTHGGNLWCCEVADTIDPPGTSNAWCLMQKTKGRQ
jgi:hypothetical protein